jgi:hypothetical protein
MSLLLLLLACTAPPPATPPSVPGPVPNPPTAPGAAPTGSGVELQDPSGFPPIHAWPAPEGPRIMLDGDFSGAIQLSSEPNGGYRPQIAVSPKDGTLHVVFYERDPAGDLIRHRRSTDGGRTWGDPVPVGLDHDRNWGPDIVARADGSVVVVYDHMRPDMTSRGYLTVWDGASWSEPEPLTPQGGEEVGSGHVANTTGDDLAYVFIGKPLGPDHRFEARGRWRQGGTWSPIAALTDSALDAWHTNVERRPDGSVLAGWDAGVGGGETTLFLADGRDGAFGVPENMAATGPTGERPHFAFAPDGRDHVVWFHKVAGRPIHIYERAGHPNAWGSTHEPSAGWGGYHFDPDIAVNPEGVLCLVWGWDAGDAAELVYSLDRGEGWSPPRLVARLNWGKPGLPSIDAGADGRFHVVWNQGVRGQNHVYYTLLEP